MRHPFDAHLCSRLTWRPCNACMCAGPCFRCGQKGHLVRDCPHRTAPTKLCLRCGCDKQLCEAAGMGDYFRCAAGAAAGGGGSGSGAACNACSMLRRAAAAQEQLKPLAAMHAAALSFYVGTAHACTSRSLGAVAGSHACGRAGCAGWVGAGTRAGASRRAAPATCATCAAWCAATPATCSASSWPR